MWITTCISPAALKDRDLKYVFRPQVHGGMLGELSVEQNVKQVLRVVDRAYVLEAGSLRMSGTADDLLQSPEIQKAFMGM